MRQCLIYLKKRFPVSRGRFGISFSVDGYTIDFVDRGDSNLVVAFDFLQGPDAVSRDRKGWAFDFLAKKKVSSMHIKPDRNCWYRGPRLEHFMREAAACGFFDRFQSVMTYGGSMGGFGALSFAGICRADSCLSMNPQVNLGAGVRSWETRFGAALRQDWTGPLCDIGRQIENTRAVVVYDPYFALDRRQVEQIDGAFMALKVPFVGHNIPVHLVHMKLMEPLFDDVLAGRFDPVRYARPLRLRRTLRRYRNILREKASASPRRLAVIEASLGAATLGMD